MRGAIAPLPHTWCGGGLCLYPHFFLDCSSPYLSRRQTFCVVFLIPYFVLFVVVLVLFNELIPVAARPKAWVCSLSLAGFAGSKSGGGMDVCLV
jgi:hypothetical protein